ncbi:MAG: hypothetical protein OZ921_05815 [Sorangiineae bacterium]|nr:hypothetical protein [Polyangiaceae bacterium]MEB2322011.1 hypothetical protein [Sorangiineae bacterium]
MVESRDEKTTSGSFGLGMRLRIAVLMLGGTVVCSGTLVAVPMVVVEKIRQGQVRSAGDAAGEIVWFLLSLVVLIVVSRAFLRTVRAARGDSEPFAWLARAVPLCVLIGVAGGAWFARHVIRSHEALTQESARGICEEALGPDASEAALTACVPVGLACNAQDDADRRARPNRFEMGERFAVRCAREKLGGAAR